MTHHQTSPPSAATGHIGHVNLENIGNDIDEQFGGGTPRAINTLGRGAGHIDSGNVI